MTSLDVAILRIINTLDVCVVVPSRVDELLPPRCLAVELRALLPAFVILRRLGDQVLAVE